MKSKEKESEPQNARAPRVLDIRAAAEYLSVGDEVVRRLVREGRLPRVMLSRKRYLFDIQDLDRLIETEKTQAMERPTVRATVSKNLYGKKSTPYAWAERYGVKRPS